LATSFAKLGPERNESLSGPRSGIVSASTSDISCRDPSSIPLLATATTAVFGTASATSWDTERRCLEGGTRSTISAPLTTSAAFDEARRLSGRS